MKVFGVVSTLKLIASKRRFRSFLPSSTEVLYANAYPHPIYFRHGTTDRFVIEEVLISEQYAPLTSVRDVGIVVDAGANIGTASVYFLEHFPNATVISIEPDPSNYSILERNVREYGSRAIAVQGALWHSKEELSLVHGSFRDGGEWSTQVRKCDGHVTSKVSAMSIADVMSRFAVPRIDVLKIDIEGAERYVFAAPDLAWLASVRCIAIELHDEECAMLFRRAIQSLGGSLERHGETTVWTAATNTSTTDVPGA